jgi:zinc transport system substrate-binding protein
MKRIVYFIGCNILMSVLSASVWALENARVVTSIQPLYLITQELLGDQADVERLMPLGASPHGFQLSWSQRRLLSESDLIIWVGPSLELFLEKIVVNQTNLSLQNVTAVDDTQPAQSSKASFDQAESHSHDNHRHDDHGHDSQRRDPHLWLDPNHVLVFARTLIDHLKEGQNTEADRALLEDKYSVFETKVLDVNQQLETLLQPVQSVPFVVFHDALQHFQQHFRLMPYDVVTPAPEQRPGAKHLHQLRKNIRQGQCLLVEPYYSAAQTRRLQSEFDLVVEEIDILGGDADSYTEFLLTLGKSIQHCLTTSL